jgi:Flp pilus assembly protein TadD
MSRSLVSSTLWLALTGCAASLSQPQAIPTAELLSGARLFDASVTNATAPRPDLFALDASMRSFVTAQIGDAGNTRTKLRRLLDGMTKSGLFSLEYTDGTTRTPRETFHEQVGNCLSFTMLFVALAREAGLEARYQLVKIPPVWSSESDLVILNNHVNALVKMPFGADYMVDFNMADFKGDYERYVVDDAYAIALYHNNLGVEALSEHDYRTSLLHLREAIRAYPDLADAWVNLCVLYSRRQLYDHAEAAYLEGLRRDSGTRSAFVNLATLYAGLGNEERAREYARKVRLYQERNPYYHYALAKRAYRERRMDDALQSLDKALRLKRDEHLFYFLRGLAYHDLGDTHAARMSFVQAQENARYTDVAQKYAAKIAALDAQ